MAKRHTPWVHFPVELIQCSAEHLPLDNHAVDQVVMSWTLCSVGDPGRALAEIRRVLPTGGSLLFIEHGRAPEPGIARWQDRLTPAWHRIAGGCHLNRPIDRLIRESGLQLAELETGVICSRGQSRSPSTTAVGRSPRDAARARAGSER
jgi:SAM-dependent methyltransferase